jgi:hypothetical protein
MAFPQAPATYDGPATDFWSLSDEDFARLPTQEKFRHIHLGMLELAKMLAKSPAALPRDRSHGE